jgi:cytochrome c peroxidase
LTEYSNLVARLCTSYGYSFGVRERQIEPNGFSTSHQPERGFADGLQVADTLAPLHRHTMTILNVGHYRWITWDGTRDSLWHQAVGPFESPKEMGTSRLYVVRSAMRYYGRELAQVAPVEVTAQEKRELIAFLHALSSDYASEWTQTPPDVPDSLSSK